MIISMEIKSSIYTICFGLIFSSILIGCNLCEPKNDLSLIKKDRLTEVDQSKIKRVGMVIKIKEDKIEEYLKLHSDSVGGVRDLLKKYNLRNFSIFMTQLDDGNFYEFGHYEYWGSNYKKDMEELSKEPRNIEWLEICDPMQIPLKGESSWKEMELIYFNN
jgi:L-rhamnose mutarotase